jgi:hypothetical protein
VNGDDVEDQNAHLLGGRTDGGGSVREREPGKWIVGMMLVGMDCVWRWAGAREGLQEVAVMGSGFEGWYWRSSVGF